MSQITSTDILHFRQDNRFHKRVMIGAEPICDNAMVTVYQTMDEVTNSSMVDLVGTGGGQSNITVLNVLPTSNGIIGDTLAGIYVKSRIWGGTVNTSAAIKIDAPEGGESSLVDQIGLMIINQGTLGQNNNYNIYSSGANSFNLFEGFVGVGSSEKAALLQVEYHALNAIAVLGEGYSNGEGGSGIGVRGVAAVGISHTANELISLSAGSPEKDEASTVNVAYGLKVDDVTVGNTNYAIKTGIGELSFGGLNPGMGMYFNPIPMVAPNSNEVTVELVGSGSTTYVYVLTYVNGLTESTPSEQIIVFNGPDELNSENYVQFTFPDNGKTYNLYRVGGGPVGFLASRNNTTYQDNNPNTPSGSSAPGPLPPIADSTTSLVFSGTNPARSIFATSTTGGLIMGAGGSYPSEMRLSAIQTGWSDSTNGITGLQLTNTLSHNAAIFAGSVGEDTPFSRLSIHSNKTAFTNFNVSGTPDPNAILHVMNGDATTIPMIVASNPGGQTADLTRWLAPNESVLVKVTPEGGVVGKFFAGDFAVVTASSAPTIDLNTGNAFYINITSDTTVSFSGGSTGQEFVIVVQQDSVGNHTWTWPFSTNNQQKVNPTPNSYTHFTLVKDGGNMIVTSCSIVRATSGSPGVDVSMVRATGSIGPGVQQLDFEAQVDGTSGNDIVINFDTSQAWGTSSAYVFAYHVIVINVKNDGNDVLDSVQTLASIVNSTSGVNSIVRVTNSPGPFQAYVAGINTATQVTLSGGVNAVIGDVAAGGELRFSDQGLFVGESNGNWKKIPYLPNLQSVSDASSLDVDLALGSTVYVNMNGSLSLTAHNMIAGQRYIFMIHQNAGDDGVSWNGSVFYGGILITSGTNATAGTTTIQEFFCPDGSSLVAVTPGNGNVPYTLA